jgi:hypothetical protein
MVVIRLKGGTGNQLFQYAFGKALEAAGNEVRFDLHYFRNDDSRRYTLDHYNTQVQFSESVGSIVSEGLLRYSPDWVKKYDQDLTLDGYWQSEKYFLPVADKVRQDFTLRQEPSEQTQRFAALIRSTPDSVFYHVRRTDNLSVRALSWHGYLPDSYYDRATAYIEERVENPHYFVFSDDIVWCRQNLRLPNSTFVDCNTPGLVCDSDYVIKAAEGNEHEDLYLMSLCQHSIVGNSTFSWWAAWLNQNSKKFVVTPDEWFLGNNNHLSLDIIPSTWKRL